MENLWIFIYFYNKMICLILLVLICMVLGVFYYNRRHCGDRTGKQTFVV